MALMMKNMKSTGPVSSAAPQTRAVMCQASSRPVMAKQASALALAGFLIASPVQAAGVDFVLNQDPNAASSPLHLDFKVDEMTVKPASEGLIPNTGHFHVNIDDEAIPEGVAIPFDATHIHYGKGQTSADVEVPKGEHKLTLQFANAKHESYGPQYAKTIAILVK